MSWATARPKIHNLLAALAITSPIVTNIKRVYDTPFINIMDAPVATIVSARRHSEYVVGARLTTYSVRIQLQVTDADQNQAFDLLDSFISAAEDAFHADLTLGGTVLGILGVDWQEWGVVEAGGGKFAIVDGIITIKIETEVAVP